jgi:predicted ester cyclase
MSQSVTSKLVGAAEANKAVVRRMVDDVMNAGDLGAIGDIYSPELAPSAREWIEPFLASFSDVHMEVVDLVAERDTVVGRFRCSGTHTAEWQGHPATGRRFEEVDEVYFFELREGRIARAWGLEDGLKRMRQLGFAP